jgi:hypothetical protein
MMRRIFFIMRYHSNLWKMAPVWVLLSLAIIYSYSRAHALPPTGQRDYTFGVLPSGLRNNTESSLPDTLSIETGFYGLSFDLADFQKSKFGIFQDDLTYAEALKAGPQRLESLKPKNLNLELELDGKVYRAMSCLAGDKSEPQRFYNLRLWESARLVQHYELLGVNFMSADGEVLPCSSSLDIYAWPQSFHLTANITPDHFYQEGSAKGIDKTGLCIIDKPWRVAPPSVPDAPSFTAELWVYFPVSLKTDTGGYLLAKNGHEHQPTHYGFKVQDERIIATINDGRGRYAVLSLSQKAPLKTNTWYHLALTCDDTIARFYVNGELQKELPLPQPRTQGKGDLFLGLPDRGGAGAFPGVFDQLRIWHRNLSPDEIKAHAAQPIVLSSTEGLKFQENFDKLVQPPAGVPLPWKNAVMRIAFGKDGKAWKAERPINGDWSEHKESVTLECNLSPTPIQMAKVSVAISTKLDGPLPAVYNPQVGAWECQIKSLKRDRSFRNDGTRNYDEIDVVVDNSSGKPIQVPVLIDLSSVASITGLCPILCEPDGTPTGIPVQFGKNWHMRKMGHYARFYTLIPCEPGQTTKKLRIAYGFYGQLPSASHSQLCLVGYGSHGGRWEQLAIGTWGETMCFDVEHDCTNVMVTDVRMLMTRVGADGPMWQWTDAGWGGDWLGVFDSKGGKLTSNSMKAAYHSHGPCLTDVEYCGFYGLDHAVRLDAGVQTLRTDDYSRVFQKLKYTFAKELPAENTWLFKMGSTRATRTPKIAIGNANGPITLEDSKPVPPTTTRYMEPATIEGPAPWWAGFPGGSVESGMPNGSRALVIRSYHAVFGGQPYTNPTVAMHYIDTDDAGLANVDLRLVAPPSVTTFKPGDTVELDVEWITYPAKAIDYYGPNTAFRKHLTELPGSWKTIYREASGNSLKINASGGSILQNYPIVVRADAPTISLNITGGVGMVPVRFVGLKNSNGMELCRVVDESPVPLNQGVHGNDFWQTDYDAKSATYSLTYNLPLDDLASSSWLLRPKPTGTMPSPTPPPQVTPPSS